MDNARKYTNRLLELCDDGLVDPKSLLESSLQWLSEDAVQGLCERLELTRMMFPVKCSYCDQIISDSDDEQEDDDGDPMHSECWHDLEQDIAQAKAEREEYEREQGPSPEQEAREVFNDKLEMYRNEY